MGVFAEVWLWEKKTPQKTTIREQNQEKNKNLTDNELIYLKKYNKFI